MVELATLGRSLTAVAVVALGSGCTGPGEADGVRTCAGCNEGASPQSSPGSVDVAPLAEAAGLVVDAGRPVVVTDAEPSTYRRPDLKTIEPQQWQASRALQRTAHAIVVQGTSCLDFLPAPPDAAIVPTEQCQLREAGDVVVCDATVRCTSDADCTVMPNGKCVGIVGAPSCVVERTTDELCASDSDCDSAPDGRCAPKLNSSVDYCYPTGDCYVGTQAICSYAERPCDNNASCGGDTAACAATIRAVTCAYFECLQDEECPAGERCTCQGCVPAACTSAADCGDGQMCVLAEACFGQEREFRCTTPDDECVAWADCAHGRCVPDSKGWRCTDEPCPGVTIP